MLSPNLPIFALLGLTHKKFLRDKSILLVLLLVIPQFLARENDLPNVLVVNKVVFFPFRIVGHSEKFVARKLALLTVCAMALCR